MVADIPPLAVLQARMGSTRLPGKMIRPLAGRPLIWWAWRRSVEAFGEDNVVVAMPATEENNVLAELVKNFGGKVFRWNGDENDVLGRFYFCAHTFRWHPNSVICRITPDDPLKQPKLMKEVSWGVRHPVELSCEATTLQELSILHATVTELADREHLTWLLSPVPPPLAPPGVWSVDTEEDMVAISDVMGVDL